MDRNRINFPTGRVIFAKVLFFFSVTFSFFVRIKIVSGRKQNADSRKKMKCINSSILFMYFEFRMA